MAPAALARRTSRSPRRRGIPSQTSEPKPVTPQARTHQTEPWAKRPTGPCSFEEAKALARQQLANAKEPGLEDIPDYVHLVLSDDNVPEDAYACYLWIGEQLENARIRWEDCLHDRTRKLPV